MTRRVVLETPSNVGELIGFLNGVLYIQSLIGNSDVGVAEFYDMQGRVSKIVGQVERWFGASFDHIPPGAELGKRFANSLIRQLKSK